MSAETAEGPTRPPPGMHRRSPEDSSPSASGLPTPQEIDRAYGQFRRTESPTPLIWSPALSRLYRRAVYLKLEGLSPIRSFKHRGALAALGGLTDTPRVVTASTGNHGQGVAYAAAQRGIDATVLVPENALEVKVQAMRSLGATVIQEGRNLSESQLRAEELASRTEAAYLEDGEDPGLMAGAAGVMLEIAEQLPEAGTVVVPVGGGNLIAGCLLATDITGTAASIVGVQSTAAPAVTESWLAGHHLERPCDTFAGGLATERPGHLSLAVLRSRLTAMGLVTEDDLYRAIARGATDGGVLLEGAAAAPLALLHRFGEEVDGDPIVLVASGSWVSGEQLTKALNRLIE